MPNTTLRLCAIVIFLLVVSFAIRITYSSTPLFDAHAWRQSVSYSISLNYLNDANILHPRTNEIFPVSNSERYFFVNFPLYEYILSMIYRLTAPTTHVARLVSSFISVLTMAITVAAYYRRNRSYFYSVFLGILFLLVPLSFHYGNAVIAEVFLSFLYASLLLLVMHRPKYIVPAAITAGIMILIKPTTGLLALPLVIAPLTSPFVRQSKSIILQSLLALLCIVGPYVLWLIYVKTTYWPASAFAYTHDLLGYNEAGSLTGYLRLLAIERLPDSLTPIGAALFAAGATLLFLIHTDYFTRILRFGVIGWILWLFSAPNGFVRHDYYLLAGIPLQLLVIIYGIQVFHKRIKELLPNFTVRFAVFGVIILCTVHISLPFWNKFVHQHKSFDVAYGAEIGLVAGKIDRGDRVIITGLYRNPTFLELSGHRGWVINSEFIETNTCPPEYKDQGDNAATDAYACYLLPFIHTRKQHGAKAFIVLRSETPNKYEEINTWLMLRFPVIYTSEEITAFSL